MSGPPRVFSSKVDAIALLALAPPPLVLVSLAGHRLPLSGPLLAVTLPLLFIGLVLPLWVLLGTDYRIEAGELRIRAGPLRWRIPVAGITRVEPTRDARSGPALSLDRLCIDYGHGARCLVSPRDAAGFVRELKHHGAKIP